MCLTAYLYDKTGSLSEEFYQYFSIGVLIESISVFCFVCSFDFDKLKDGIKHLISEISNCTFGIYLIHLFVFYLVKLYIIPSNISFEPILCVPVLVSLVLSVSAIIIIILKKIPFINKWCL